jgi:hypothetical protein
MAPDAARDALRTLLDAVQFEDERHVFEPKTPLSDVGRRVLLDYLRALCERGLAEPKASARDSAEAFHCTMCGANSEDYCECSVNDGGG